MIFPFAIHAILQCFVGITSFFAIHTFDIVYTLIVDAILMRLAGHPIDPYIASALTND